MKRNFITLLLSLTAIFAVNCKTADNANNANANHSAVVNTASTNENTAVKTQSETVPTFTDADEAAAAGVKYLDASATENAINSFRQAVKLNPDLAEAYFQLGIAYSLREKENADSTETVEETTAPPKKGKKDATAVLSDADKAFDNAAKVYEKLLKKNPKDDQALFNLGRAYNKLNKDPEAEKALRQAVKLAPDNNDYQIELGAILIKLAKYDEAVSVLSKAAKLDDSNLYLQDLLEKAEAGKKRINFGIKPKPPQEQQQENSKPKPDKTQTKPTVEPSAKPTPKVEPTKKV